MDLGGPHQSGGAESVTQMHAAAVNGDKSMLAKLIVGKLGFFSTQGGSEGRTL
jgi:hypothetical protein